jgi:hypothetical protein
MRSLVFVDFDGVLNSDAFYTRNARAAKEGDLDPKCVRLLNDLVVRSGAKVVIASSWRHDHSVSELRAIMVKRGFEHAGRVIGKTPDLGEDGVRGYEILAFLKNLKMEKRPFVVLDDTDDMDGVEDCFVRTNPKVGLQRKDVEVALRILRRGIR